MHGAIAAGSAITADAGAAALRRGGNAVDAAVAACFATAAGEPTLTSLAGGGVLLYRDAADGEVTVCDFFADAPGLGGTPPAELDFVPVELDFGPATQVFHIGAASAAVPGALPGLCSAHERWGRLPLSEVVAPACRVLREGAVLSEWQARAAKLLTPILTYSGESRRQFCVGDRLMRAGDRFGVPALADTLERLARGWREYYRDGFCASMIGQFGAGAGGLLTQADLDAYQVSFRRPLQLSYRGHRVFTNPPPAAGGEMIAAMLQLLADETPGALVFGDDAHVRLLAAVMQVADEARAAGRLQRLLAGEMTPWRDRVRQLQGRLSSLAPTPGGPSSTTHVSVIDSEGGAATVSFSYGEGCGLLIEGTGVMMNNLMGEQDLHPQGFHRMSAGHRLSTMMSPMLVVAPSGVLTALGSGGANRIRSALVQVVCNLVDFGMPVERAVDAARMHYEAGRLSAEVHQRDDEGAALARLADEWVAFDRPNLFFGGVHVAQRAADGSPAGAGDPRRGGCVRVV